MRIRSALDLPPEMRAQVEGALAGAPCEGAKPAKYRNQVVEQDGVTFDSKWELQRWNELRALEAARLITDLRHGVPFALHARTPDGAMVRIGSYEADFVYVREGHQVIEDTKSAATRTNSLFRWKAAHFEVEYGMRIIEVMRTHRHKARQPA